MAVADLLSSFIHVAGWSQHRSQQPSPRPLSARPFGHLRSLSSIATTTTSSSSSPPSPSPSPSPAPAPAYKGRLASKSPSTSHLPKISLTPSPLPVPFFNDEMSTLPDPRRRALSAASPHDHPGLDGEVATLSTKLVKAINHQTVLDDTLTATRQELQAARDRIHELENANQQQRDMMAGDVWVRRSTLDADRKAIQAEKKSLQAKLTEETNKRLDTDAEKRKMEQELENLTTALFEEANQMVIAAKEEAQVQHEALQRKIDQLKTQLADSESLLKSQQEQLCKLKQVMECMAAERDDQTTGTTPSSPGIYRLESSEDYAAQPNGLHGSSPSPDSMTPCNPTNLHHLVQPVLRTDLATFEDFSLLARSSQQRRGSRVSSGSLGSLTALALGLGGSTSSAHPSNASTSSLSASVAATSSAPQSPNTPASTASAASSAPVTNLTSTRFYKRVLAEDIEPTLRLDIAPGLSWLARRSVLTSMTDGSLVVEPVSTTPTTSPKLHTHPCSLCGESRKDAHYLRTHRFKTSEADSAQRYPLCSYCLGRVRSTCDFLGFLRMVKDGHWRANAHNHEKAAWEESVRLREQMFWARIGGGVVPSSHAPAHSTGPASTVTDKDDRPSLETPDETALNNDAQQLPHKDLHHATQHHHDAASLPEPHTPPDQTGPRARRISAQSVAESASTTE
ncbi:hypothetical protein CDD82_4245 [Ophiocordyceps australis]|uniref:GDP/GTP exchange factor Sec2 N-terminal domain-containing protein n=1 Tax=Ophiocordyceps australis TaxID=1399860 RepID=A0A2C5Z777_9HYPO|nr:hypothetical protein CDD82_4245 [Ophiocordyceps australis]